MSKYMNRGDKPRRCNSVFTAVTGPPDRRMMKMMMTMMVRMMMMMMMMTRRMMMYHSCHTFPTTTRHAHTATNTEDDNPHCGPVGPFKRAP